MAKQALISVLLRHKFVVNYEVFLSLVNQKQKGGDHMTNDFKLKLTLATSVAGMLLTASSAWASTATVSNTGAGSSNIAKVVEVQESVVDQTNRSRVNNWIDLGLFTGNNTANHNTGSAVVNTGSAMTSILISNLGSSNELVDNDCGCDQSMDDSVIDTTGAGSYNRAVVRRFHSRARLQRNMSAFVNSLRNRLRTGGNHANGNTGDAAVISGPTDAMVDLLNEGNSNTLP